MLINLARVSFNVIGLVGSARQFESDRSINSDRMFQSLVGLVKSIMPFDHDKVDSSARIASLAHNTMDEFIPFIIASMTLIYIRNLVGVFTMFASQIGLLLGLATGNDGSKEGLLPLFVT